MTVLIVDISEFQPNISDATYLKWSQAAIIRAMYGDAHDDKAWYGGARRDALHSGGVRWLGIYQYIVASQPVATQARALLALIGTLRAGELLIADIEEGEGNQLARWRAWAQVIKAATGQAPWSYSNLDFAREHGLKPDWVAAFGTVPPPKPWTLWQFSESYEVPGVGTADCSRFDGAIDQLAGLGYQPEPAKAPAPKPAPKPAPTASPGLPAGWQEKLAEQLPVLKLGDKDHGEPTIADLQGLLDSLGITCKADGIFGSATETAVKEYQGKHGLKADGVVDPLTWSALITGHVPTPGLI
jgi:peptidoglycan hydrolase-like protein with peptidoglycan-binding domain